MSEDILGSGIRDGRKVELDGVAVSIPQVSSYMAHQ